MTLLGYPDAELEAAGGIWTAREIAQQPAVWRRIVADMSQGSGATRRFLEPLLARPDLRIVLTGAGTSAFVGECLASALKHRTQRRVDAVATTDLIGSPATWLEPVPTLLVSFARSGNSPESVAALAVVQQGVRDCHHLIVTCNREGALYRQGSALSNAHVLLLPEETHDRGFAMTSSFTGMMLATALAFGLMNDRPVPIADWATRLLESTLPLLAELAQARFERVVYLGGAEFRGLAREAALKLLELSDGKVVAMADTPLGFRHGPKTVVNERTLVIVFLSNDPHSRRYETDVLKELRSDGVAARVLAVQAGAATADAASADTVAVSGAVGAADLALCFPFAVFAQAFALLQSLALGLRPDTPNVRGVVSRVVQGVTIYPWAPSR